MFGATDKPTAALRRNLFPVNLTETFHEEIMAEIVLGIGTSHGPMLSTPWEKWAGRVAADKQLAAHDFKGSTYSFDELVALRQDENLAAQITPELWQVRRLPGGAGYSRRQIYRGRPRCRDHRRQ